MPLALPRESWLLLLESGLSLLHRLDHGWPWPWSTKLRYHVSFRGTSREPQGLWAEQARSTLFTLLFFSSLSQTRHGSRLQYTAAV